MISSVLRIGYFVDGLGPIKPLDLLTSDPGLEVSFICARFANPDPRLREKALELGIQFYVSENVNSATFLQSISVHQSDIFVSMSLIKFLGKVFTHFHAWAL